MTQKVCGLSFSWDVELPERGSASLGGRLPLATLAICSESHGQERIPIPKAVGRRLVSLLESDGDQPSGRSELLYRVRVISLELARSKAEELLNRRDYSSSELAAKLRRPGTTPPWPTRSLRGSSRSAFLMMSGLRAVRPAPRLRPDGGASRSSARQPVAVSTPHSLRWPSGYLENEPETAFAPYPSAGVFQGRTTSRSSIRFLCGRRFPPWVWPWMPKRSLQQRPRRAEAGLPPSTDRTYDLTVCPCGI